MIMYILSTTSFVTVPLHIRAVGASFFLKLRSGAVMLLVLCCLHQRTLLFWSQWLILKAFQDSQPFAFALRRVTLLPLPRAYTGDSMTVHVLLAAGA